MQLDVVWEVEDTGRQMVASKMASFRDTAAGSIRGTGRGGGE